MLIDTLKHFQARDNFTDQQFANKIGIHRVSWIKIKTHRVGFGKKFLSGVRQAFPELKDAIDVLLSGEVKPYNQFATVSIPTVHHQTHQNKILGALRRFLDELLGRGSK